ncbi:MAG: hypothetical protein L6R48_17590 [Planctomycetes bacterium]|nr:hypothetical protein [Planctomycetota bacterium]
MRLLPTLLLLASATLGFAADGAVPAKDPNAGVVTDPAACETWTTENGTKYHTKDCANAKIKTTLAQSLSEGDEPCKQCQPPVYDAAKVVVFASENGGKYHLFSCRFAKKQTTLAQAVKDGLAPCAVCKAPALWTKPAAPATAPAAK